MAAGLCRLEGDEDELTGEPIGLPRPALGELSTRIRNHGYDLGDRLIAERRPELDPLVGRKVRLRGTPVVMQLEWADLHEIAPAGERLAE